MLDTLKHDLFLHPSASLIYAAKYAAAMLGDERPDWLAALANGNPEMWESVIDVAKELCVHDEQPSLPAHAQKGQSMTEVALALGVIAVLILALMAVLAPKGDPSPAARDLAARVDMSVSHAEVRHGTEAEAAQRCLDRHGPAQTWSKPSMNRMANVCFEGKDFYIQILEKRDGTWYEITKFLRTQAKSLGDVGQYLKSNGYVK